MRLDSHKTGNIKVHQMKKFFIHNFSKYTSVWSEMSNIFKMDDDSVVISYPVSLELCDRLERVTFVIILFQ